MKLSERITHWRERANLKQADLARKLEVSSAAVSMWESDKATPSTENLLAIADACGVSMHKFWEPIPRRAS